jgi:hypothetical protein
MYNTTIAAILNLFARPSIFVTKEETNNINTHTIGENRNARILER